MREFVVAVRRRGIATMMLIGIGILLAGGEEARAFTGDATTRNTTVRFDGGRVVDWEVDGAHHLDRMSFWIQVGDQSPQEIANANPNMIPDPGLSGIFTLPSFAVGYGSYGTSGLDISLAYFATGLPDGSRASDILPHLSVSNTTNAAIDIRIYQLVNLDLAGDAADDGVTFVNANAVRQSDGHTHVETVFTPRPDAALAGQADALLSAIIAGQDLETAFVGMSAQGDDVGWALQWDRMLAPAGRPTSSFMVSEDMNMYPAPEPITMVSMGLCLLGVGRYVRRRKKAQQENES